MSKMGHRSPAGWIHAAIRGEWSTWCLLFLLAVATSPASAATQGHPVTLVPLGKLLFHPVREAPARVVSLNNSIISAEIAGKVTEVTRRPGDQVSEGDLLAKLDCSTYVIARKRAEAAVEAARARFDYARKRFRDAEKLVKSRNISSDAYNQRSSEFNRLSAELNIHRADLEEAKWRESRCVIRAPFDAVVTERRASRGDYATPGTPLVRIVDLDHLEVSAQVQQQDLEEMKQARELEFLMDGKGFPLKLRAVVPLLESRVRSFEVRYDFRDRTPPPGAAGRLRWKNASPHVPASYLVQRDGRLGLFLFDDEKSAARFHPLPGAIQGLPAVVDLPPDAAVIDAGRFSLKDGDPVRVIEP